MLFMLEKKDYAYGAWESEGHLSPTPHLHTHIEIVLVEKGVTHAIADDRECDMEAGDLFIAFPNQIHYYLDKTPTVSPVLLIVSPDICPEFNRIFKTMRPESPVLPAALLNERIHHAVRGILDAYQRQESFTDSEARGHLLVLFSEIFRAMPLAENGSCETDIMKNIIHFCYENYDTDISLGAIADALHISRYTVSHLFSRKLHTGFNDYINSLRISRACEFLRSGDMPITEIAYTVGYNAIRSFNRCFQEIMHMTPKEYRQQRREKKHAPH